MQILVFLVAQGFLVTLNQALPGTPIVSESLGGRVGKITDDRLVEGVFLFGLLGQLLGEGRAGGRSSGEIGLAILTLQITAELVAILAK